ncbi:hypothetical protein N9W34_01820 [Rickettsiales bacterium]|nr:hypothetical protein [Rickettsiales bacterium]
MNIINKIKKLFGVNSEQSELELMAISGDSYREYITDLYNSGIAVPGELPESFNYQEIEMDTTEYTYQYYYGIIDGHEYGQYYNGDEANEVFHRDEVGKAKKARDGFYGPDEETSPPPAYNSWAERTNKSNEQYQTRTP